MSLYLGTTPIANTGYDKANTDLSNLTNTGKNIANWSNNVTNCITEIPQDIKLELNDGTLTLKAGSKVYVPNGFEADGTTPKFDVVTIDSDKAVSFQSWSSNPRFFVYNPTTKDFSGIILNQSSSGSSVSPSQSTWMWYDTANNLNKITTNTGSTWTSEYCLPICICTNVQNTSSSIDQVFNGFGYIGSTIFALPGVKGLIPNGRNTDGSLKSTEITLTKVLTNTANYDRESDGYTTLVLGQNALDYTRDYAVSNTRPSNPRSWSSYYSEKDNFIYRYNGSSWNQGNNVVVGVIHRNTSSPWAVTSLTPKTVFHAVDYNDSSTISGWSMPSSRYIDLTLGASGTSYTAPANGWLSISKVAGASDKYIHLANSEKFGIQSHSVAGSDHINIFIPAAKGDSVSVSYNLTGNTNYFRFCYAEGEN